MSSRKRTRSSASGASGDNSGAQGDNHRPSGPKASTTRASKASAPPPPPVASLVSQALPHAPPFVSMQTFHVPVSTSGPISRRLRSVTTSAPGTVSAPLSATGTPMFAPSPYPGMAMLPGNNIPIGYPVPVVMPMMSQVR